MKKLIAAAAVTGIAVLGGLGEATVRLDDVEPGIECSIATPDGAPARFIGCTAAGSPADLTLAIVTPGSHCVAADIQREVAVTCGDGTSVELRQVDGGLVCHLSSDATRSIGATGCTLRDPDRE